MQSKSVKIAVFVPDEYADQVRQAMGDAGAGVIGNYSHCSFTSTGIGRYKPLPGSHPTIGKVGEYQEVTEQKIECLCQRVKVKDVLAAVRRVHPYEEVAFDIYPLISEKEL